MKIGDLKSLEENKKCHCNQIEIAYFKSNDDPGYVQAQLSILSHLALILGSGKGTVTVFDMGPSTSLYSQSRVQKLLRQNADPFQDLAKTSKAVRIVDVSRSGRIPIPLELKGALGNAVRGDVHSMTKDDRVSRSLITRTLEWQLWRWAEVAFGVAQTVFQSRHYCFAVILNGRHTVDTALKLAARAAGISELFWEGSPSGRGRLFLASHQPQDYYAFLNEAREATSKNLDFGETQSWLESRFSSSSGSNRYSSKFEPLRSQPRHQNENLVAFFTASQDERWALDQELAPARSWDSQYAGFEKVLHILGPSYTPVIRMHPNTLNKSVRYVFRETLDVARLLRLFPSLLLYLPWSKQNSYDLVKRSHLVVTSSSTIGAESLAMGKKAVHLNSSKYQLSSGMTLFNGRDLTQREAAASLQKIALTEFWLQLDHETVELRTFAIPKRKKYGTFLAIRSWVAIYILVKHFSSRITSRCVLAPLAILFRDRVRF